MKKYLISIGIFTALTSSTVNAAGIPSFDIAQVTNSMIQIMNQIKDAQTFIAQLKNQKEQLKAMIDYKGFGDIAISFNDFEKLTGFELKGFLDDIARQGASALSGEARSIYREMGYEDLCKHSVNQSCEKIGAVEAQRSATYEKLSKSSMQLAKKLISKSERIMLTKDPKAIQEMVASNQADLQLIQLQAQAIQLMEKTAALEKIKFKRQEQARKAKLMEAYRYGS